MCTIQLDMGSTIHHTGAGAAANGHKVQILSCCRMHTLYVNLLCATLKNYLQQSQAACNQLITAITTICM